MKTGGPSVTPDQWEDFFVWLYLPGSDLKPSLSYPNSLTASWRYDANNQLLQVCNAFDVNDDEGVIATQSSPGGSHLVATAYTANSLNQYSSISTSDF